MSGKQRVAKPGSDSARAADEASLRADPHGVHPANESKDHEPTGMPNSDRHDTETAAGRAGPPAGQQKH